MEENTTLSQFSLFYKKEKGNGKRGYKMRVSQAIHPFVGSIVTIEP